MGGKPYGRPMTMTGDDLRDGLALDAQTFCAGPFLSMMPSGLLLQLTLQGDVIQKATIVHPPLTQAASSAPFRTALQEPVSIVALECARAAHHLRCVARFLATRGFTELSARFLSRARAVAAGRISSIERLVKSLELSGVMQCVPAGLGRLNEDAAERLEGMALRTMGVASDARSDHPAYKKLGFRPVLQRSGDVRARLRQWLDEAEQSLALAAAATDSEPVEFRDGIEGPSGFPQREGAEPEPVEVSGWLGGLEWGNAVAVLASFETCRACGELQSRSRHDGRCRGHHGGRNPARRQLSRRRAGGSLGGRRRVAPAILCAASVPNCTALAATANGERTPGPRLGHPRGRVAENGHIWADPHPVRNAARSIRSLRAHARHRSRRIDHLWCARRTGAAEPKTQDRVHVDQPYGLYRAGYRRGWGAAERRGIRSHAGADGRDRRNGGPWVDYGLAVLDRGLFLAARRRIRPRRVRRPGSPDPAPHAADLRRGLCEPWAAPARGFHCRIPHLRRDIRCQSVARRVCSG